MCARYGLISSPERLKVRFRTTNAPPGEMPTSCDIEPPQLAPVVRLLRGTGERRLDLLRWGLTPSFIADPKGGRQPTTAPAETVANSAMFRYSFGQQRCLVPADFIYDGREAPDGSPPSAVGSSDGAPLALAGVWEAWQPPSGAVVYSYAIITTVAKATTNGRDDRVPAGQSTADERGGMTTIGGGCGWRRATAW